MREFIGNTLLHFGWIFYGQPCGCGYGINFNYLAHKVEAWEQRRLNTLDPEVLHAQAKADYEPLYWQFGSFVVGVADHYFEDVL